VHRITEIDETGDGDETGRMASTAVQRSVHTATDYALRSREVNTQLLRLTSQAWIESFRFRSTLFQGTTQAFFGQWKNALASTTHAEGPAQEKSRSEVKGPIINGVGKDTEVASEGAFQKVEKQRAGALAAGMRAPEKAAEEAQKRTATAHFPVEGYDEMKGGEISEHLDGLSVEQLKRVKKYEKNNKNRRSLRKEIKQKIKSLS
jgi:hypothetical protein